MTSEDLDDLMRWLHTADTWFLKASHKLKGLHEADPRPEPRWLLGYEGSRFLFGILNEAVTTMPSVLESAEDEHIAEVLGAARSLVAALEERERSGRRSRLATKLEDVAGRTPEEAAAFLAKAAELRS